MRGKSPPPHCLPLLLLFVPFLIRSQAHRGGSYHLLCKPFLFPHRSYLRPRPAYPSSPYLAASMLNFSFPPHSESTPFLSFSQLPCSLPRRFYSKLFRSSPLPLLCLTFFSFPQQRSAAPILRYPIRFTAMPCHCHTIQSKANASLRNSHSFRQLAQCGRYPTPSP